MATQWAAVLSGGAHVYGHGHGHGHKHGKHSNATHPPGEPTCTWPIPIISRTRDLDLTECFELAVLLPLPLVITFISALVQVILVRSRLRRTGSGSLDWIKRAARSERVAVVKSVSQVLSGTGCVHCLQLGLIIE